MIVLDASVTVKWFASEPGSAEARSLVYSGNELVAPELLQAEVASALVKKALRQQLNPEEARGRIIPLVRGDRRWRHRAAAGCRLPRGRIGAGAATGAPPARLPVSRGRRAPGRSADNRRSGLRPSGGTTLRPDPDPGTAQRVSLIDQPCGWFGSIQRTSSGCSAGSMSRLTTTDSWPAAHQDALQRLVSARVDLLVRHIGGT
jgi:hypothetical protein